jgi:DNA-binding IclR family transcriptional regulator
MKFDPEPAPAEGLLSSVSPASQTLVRGLDVLEQVAAGPAALSAIARQLGLSRSTVHRLATTLLERRYLNVTPRRGYSLGPKLLELGFRAREQISLVRLARPYLEALAAETGDVAILAVRDGDDVLIADRAAGRRRVLPSVRTGDRVKLDASALGHALGLQPADMSGGAPAAVVRSVSGADPAPEIRTIAAPVFGADGSVRAALGIAAASVYADRAHHDAAAAAVKAAARAMGAELGWQVSAPGSDAPVSGSAARQLPDGLPEGRGGGPAASAEAVAGSGVVSNFDEGTRDRMGGPKA